MSQINQLKEEVNQPVEEVKEEDVKGKTTVFSVNKEGLKLLYNVSEALTDMNIFFAGNGLRMLSFDPSKVVLIDASVKGVVKGLGKTVNAVFERSRVEKYLKVCSVFENVVGNEKYVPVRITPVYRVRKHSDGRVEKEPCRIEAWIDEYMVGEGIPEVIHEDKLKRVKAKLVKATADAKALLKIVKSSVKVSDVIGFWNHKGKMKIGVEVDGEFMWRNVDGVFNVKGVRQFKTYYHAETLSKIIYPFICETVTIRIGTNMPMCITHKSRRVTVNTWIAPRITEA